MAVSPFKTFVPGEVLTASDLNNSLLQVFNNGLALWSPATSSPDLDGMALIVDADADTTITADTDDQIDFQLAGADNFRMLLDSTVPDFRAEWADAGAATGPHISLYRNSASPANDDLIGRFRFLAEDSAGNTQHFASIEGQIAAVTNAAESGRVLINAMQGGTERVIARFNGADSELRLRSHDAGATQGPTLTLHRSSASPAAADVAGGVNFDGMDSGGTQTTYASIHQIIDDTTDTSEDAHLRVQALRAGSLVTCVAPLVPQGAVATTSGTSVDFTVTTDATMIVIAFNEISLSGTDNLIVRIGTGGSPASSGYVSSSAAVVNAGATGVAAITSGFNVQIGDAARVLSGHMILTHLGSNLWIASFYSKLSTTVCAFGGGSVTLGGSCNIVRLITSTTDTFDAGSVQVFVG